MRKKELIPMFYPHVPETVIEKLAETLRTRWVGQGPKVDEFEKEFQSKFGFACERVEREDRPGWTSDPRPLSGRLHGHPVKWPLKCGPDALHFFL